MLCCCATGVLPWDVFVSHAGESKPYALALGTLLGQMGLRAFVDKVALKPGGDVSRLFLQFKVSGAWNVLQVEVLAMLLQRQEG